jgi:hypothetical protein
MISRVSQLMILTALTAALFGTSTRAGAQDVPREDRPIGRFAADVRGTFPKFKQDPNVASGIGVKAANLPTRAFGLVVGAHWYPTHIGVMTLGLGGEVMMAGRSRTLEAATTTTGTTGTTAVPGPTVHSHVSALSPQVSFNFGKHQGWSYISGGIGWSNFTAERQDAPLPAQASRSKTINYGGGARWFSKKRIALSADLRFYAINPQLATATRPAFPRMTLMAFSVGAAFK